MAVYRRHLRNFPAMKESCLNVCLFGFPNVGKSTLLAKLTTAKPEIANYAFTTKGINIGYQQFRNMSIQVIDTPGTLNRFDTMNDIEKMAYLVMTKLADVVVYVCDPTESYAIEEQKALYDVAQKSSAKLVGYCSKTDIAQKDAVTLFTKEFNCVNYEDIQQIFEKEAGKLELELLKDTESALQKQIVEKEESAPVKRSREAIIKKLRKK
jgi:nucleolar GTP-binding protein